MKTYVSLTSIKHNENILIKTLESIKNQIVKPDKTFLFLSEEPYLLDTGFENKKINSELDAFLKNNQNDFELIWCPNIGPYRKLLPLLKEKLNEDCCILAVDDDTEYQNKLVKKMIDDYENLKCCISYRGFTMKVTGNLNDLNYEDRLPLIPKNLFNFHTGKGGVLYHPSFFKNTCDIIFNRETYLECCETGDDIWFNFMRIANNIPCYVKNINYMTKDNTKNHSLYYVFNDVNNLNTKNIKKTVNKLIDLKFLIT